MKRFVMIALLFILSIVLVCISYPVMNANAKKVIIENITLNVTVIIPITVVAQNAQICISLASSGDQTCQQIILDPTQTTLTPINVDLTEEVSFLTNESMNQSGTTNQTGTATPTSNETSSFAGNSNKTFEPGKSNITNPTNDPESKSNQHGQSTDSPASNKENVKEDKDTTEEEQEEAIQGEDPENGSG